MRLGHSTVPTPSPRARTESSQVYQPNSENAWEIRHRQIPTTLGPRHAFARVWREGLRLDSWPAHTILVESRPRLQRATVCQSLFLEVEAKVQRCESPAQLRKHRVARTARVAAHQGNSIQLH